MADSDDEYVGDSGDDLGAGIGSKGGRGSKGKGAAGRKGKGGSRKAAWEDIQRSWENVAIAEDGTFSVAELLEAEKRRRLMRDTTPLQRGIIRHLMLVLDMSVAMAEKDLLPNRYLLTLNYAVEFVREYFEQNPISQLGIVGMRDGIAVRISDMSGNPAEHIEKLRQWAEQHEPQGSPSLQNALEMCRGALFHTPSHGTREVLIIYGALQSSDPGDINETIANLITDRIRVSIVGLAAQVAICAELCTKTNNNDDSRYRISLHEQHFRELFMAATTPPVTHDPQQQDASLLMMGFPSRSLASKDHVSLCACHHRPSREGYACTRCRTKVCRLPAECPACGLTLILSTHLARSYHHLFPLKGWVAVPWSEAKRSTACYSCLTPFPTNPANIKHTKIKLKVKGVDKTIENAKGKGVVPADEAADTIEDPAAKSKVHTGVSESGRYKCQVCGNHFCIDCDVFAHEIVHNCPGCQSDTRGQDGGAVGGGEAMVID
ncbi:TFIIH basal transcription factor complex p47 subunit [Podospora australis]|uniref:General transcription and DNA repair factor IIH n=1 Tax=Podospora australis TaxID=1536484 RepID=A0AAN6WYH2_9PEZI|nr:TFIIH basal transcription factor complex p47 subunit [Podospora australis]